MTDFVILGLFSVFAGFVGYFAMERLRVSIGNNVIRKTESQLCGIALWLVLFMLSIIWWSPKYFMVCLATMFIGVVYLILIGINILKQRNIKSNQEFLMDMQTLKAAIAEHNKQRLESSLYSSTGITASKTNPVPEPEPEQIKVPEPPKKELSSELKAEMEMISKVMGDYLKVD